MFKGVNDPPLIRCRAGSELGDRSSGPVSGF